MRSPDNYHLLIEKLDEFIRKYYKNQLIRGGIYALASILASILLIDSLEYYFYFNSIVRALLFYSFITLNGILVYMWLLKPLRSLYKLGSTISHNQAAGIIGRHFLDVQDKLLNTLQLHELSKDSSHRELIEASINQKIEQLKPIPFHTAINLKENKKYLKYALIPLCIIVVIIFTAPGIITESSNRLIKYNTFFEKQAPFHFTITNEKLQAMQGEDFDLHIKLSGEEIPQDIYLVDEENRYKLEKRSTINFSHTLKNLQKTKRFRLFAAGFYSREYEITVLPNPTLLNFGISLEFPSYLNRKPEQVSNQGDLNIPIGTKVTWTFTVENTRKLRIVFDGKEENAFAKNERQYTFSKRALKNASYSIIPQNEFAAKKDSIVYTINIIPDLYPGINVQHREDSADSKLYYFVGNVKDDYGFKMLTFNYKFTATERAELKDKSFVKSIPINKNTTDDQFFYYWNLSETGVQPGENIEYYFEIFDNDGVNGSKSTRSSLQTFRAPTEAEIEKQTEKNSEEMKDKLSEAKRMAEEIQRETRRLNEKLINKKDISFEERKAIKDLIEKQKQLENAVQEIQKQNELNNRKEQEYKKLEESIQEKKKMIEDIFNNVLDEETKKLLEQLQQLLDKNNKNLTQEELEKLKMNNEQLEKELDRMLELYKQLEFEQKLSEVTEKLEELSKKQEELSTKTDQENTDSKELQEEQEDLNKELEDVKEDLKDLENKNEELEDKTEFENPQEEMNSIEQDMENSSGQLEKGGKAGKKNASKSQKSASKKMKNLSQKLGEMQQAMEMENAEENLKAIRDVLENLVKVSFEQEATMQALKQTTINDPKYLTLSQRQKALKDDIQMIEDSLYALSKRMFQLSSFVNKEVAQIDQNMQKSLESLKDRRINEATNRQQYVMTSVNNLAVMLSEALDQLQQQMMSSMMKGKGGAPSKSKGKKQSMSGLSKLQQQLNQQMQQMKQGMKPGEKPGKGQTSEQMARMVQQQQAIRQALQELSKEENKDGTGKLGNLDKLAKEMEKTEKDLYNKMINEETLKRQQDIMTRLLDAEKAEREREQDNKRESKQGRQQEFNYNIVFEEYQKLREKELELIKTVPPSLNSFYKQKINTYFQQLNQEGN